MTYSYEYISNWIYQLRYTNASNDDNARQQLTDLLERFDTEVDLIHTATTANTQPNIMGIQHHGNPHNQHRTNLHMTTQVTASNLRHHGGGTTPTYNATVTHPTCREKKLVLKNGLGLVSRACASMAFV